MSRFFSAGPFPLGVVARVGAAFFAVILAAVRFFGVIFLEMAFLLISAPELALDRSTRFRVWRKGCARFTARRKFSRKLGLASPKLISSANHRRTATSRAAARRGDSAESRSISSNQPRSLRANVSWKLWLPHVESYSLNPVRGGHEQVHRPPNNAGVDVLRLDAHAAQPS